MARGLAVCTCWPLKRKGCHGHCCRLGGMRNSRSCISAIQNGRLAHRARGLLLLLLLPWLLLKLLPLPLLLLCIPIKGYLLLLKYHGLLRLLVLLLLLEVVLLVHWLLLLLLPIGLLLYCHLLLMLLLRAELRLTLVQACLAPCKAMGCLNIPLLLLLHHMRQLRRPMQNSSRELPRTCSAEGHRRSCYCCRHMPWLVHTDPLVILTQLLQLLRATRAQGPLPRCWVWLRLC